MMDQREKLIELVAKALDAPRFRNKNGCFPTLEENVADILIYNGVVVLPCKIGDTMWSASSFTDGKVREGYISAFLVDESGAYGFHASFGVEPISVGFLIEEIGMTVFFTKEEAEKALARRKGGDE